jgi:hypothetical protein
MYRRFVFLLNEFQFHAEHLAQIVKLLDVIAGYDCEVTTIVRMRSAHEPRGV